MRNLHDTETFRAADRHAKTAAAPSAVGISKRQGGGGRIGRGRGGRGEGGREEGRRG